MNRGVTNTVVVAVIVAIILVSALGYYIFVQIQEKPPHETHSESPPPSGESETKLSPSSEQGEAPSPPPEEGGAQTTKPHGPPQLEITVSFVESSYKVASGNISGWFYTGQDADIMLSGIDFNKTGGPLLFNHPMDIASDGKHLLLADTWNNRILIWNSLPTNNTPPDIVLGQPNFDTNNPGRGRDQLNWPVSVATDGQHVVVADTNNHRILIWNSFPTRNGQPADIVLEGVPPDPERPETYRRAVAWPWGVWTDGKKLVVSSTGAGLVLIWNIFPTEDNQPADIYIKGDFLGTPRQITSDGNFLIVGDHNPKINDSPVSYSVSFVWKTFPSRDNQPYDFYLKDPVDPASWLRGDITLDGKLILFGTRLHIWNSFPTGPEDKPDLTLEFNCRWGDGSRVIYAGGRLYLVEYNGNKVLVFNKIPDSPLDKPDFAIGASDIYTNTLETNFFITNPVPISDGESLFVLSDFDRKLYVWRSLPDESGAWPDIVYKFGIYQPWDGAIYKDKLVIAGEATVLIWDAIPRNGELPNRKFVGGIGNVKFKRLRGVALDDKYFYLADEEAGKIYVWNGIPESSSTDPLFSVDVEHVRRITSDGKYLAVTRGSLICLFEVDKLGPNSKGIPVEGARVNLAEHALVAKGHLFVADTCNSRVLAWRNISDAIAGKPPDVVLGQEELVPLRPEEVRPQIGRDKLFWPAALSFDGNYLWVGEYKFSNRLLRFSPSPAWQEHIETISIPVYPGAQSTYFSDEAWADMGVPSDADRQAYMASATIDEVSEWYKSQMAEWTIMNEKSFFEEEQNISLYYVLLKKNAHGAYIFIMKDPHIPEPDKIVIGIASGPWELLKDCQPVMIEAGPEGEGAPYPVEPPFTYLPELGEGNVTFTVSPIELDAIDWIEPLGRMNAPSGHVIPTEHGGFVLKNPSIKYQLRAPADGIIFEIIHRTKYDEYQLRLAHSNTFVSIFDHVSGLSDLVKQGLQEGEKISETPDEVDYRVKILVKAGEILGTVGGHADYVVGFDWSVYDKDVNNSFVNPKRYNLKFLHGTHFIPYCEESLKEQYLSRLPRTAEPRYGKFCYDQLGKLVGNWISERLPEGDPDVSWDAALAFAYDPLNPSRLLVGIGGDLIGERATYMVHGNAPDPADIEVSSGKVIYYLEPYDTNPDAPRITLLVQMISDEKIKVETFQGWINNPEFTENARYYIR